MSTDDKQSALVLRLLDANEERALRAIRTRWDAYQLSIKMFGKEETDRAFSENGGIPTEPTPLTLTVRHVEIIAELEIRAWSDGREIDPSSMSVNPARHHPPARSVGSYTKAWHRDELDDWDRLDELTTMGYVAHRPASTDLDFRLTDRGIALAHAARRWRIVHGGKANYDGFVKEWTP